MDRLSHVRILKRVGSVLVAVGLIDIAIMVYCVANSIAYSSSFNIFAVVAGIFLMRGSLRAASIVHWFALFMLAGFLALSVAWPFMQPFDLTLTQLRLNPGSDIAAVAFIAFVVALLFWLTRELNLKPIQAARAAAGLKDRNIRIPIAGGIGLVVFMALFMGQLLGGETAARAKSVAKQQLGSGFSYHVSSLNITKNSQGTFVDGVVTAWNHKEIKEVPVQWEERQGF